MKKAYFGVAAMLLLTTSIFAFKTNKKFNEVTTLKANGVTIATGTSGHWYDDNNSNTAYLASLSYNSTTVSILYNATNQVYFKP